MLNSIRLCAYCLRQSKARLGHLILTIGLAVVAWVTLTTMAAPFLQPNVSNNANALIIGNANEGALIPLKYAPRLSAMAGVRSLVYTNAMLIVCKGDVPPVSINGFGGPGAASAMLTMRVNGPDPTKAIEAWLADPQGVLAGAQTAKDCGWRAGMSVSPREYYSQAPINLHITAILPADESPLADQVAFAHFDYLNHSAAMAGSHDQIAMLTALSASPRAVAELAARIEAAFAYDDPPLVVTPITEFQTSLARFGQVQFALAFVLLAACLCTMLVVISVLAHAATIRRPQLAVLLALGFPRAALRGSIALEGLLIVGTGAGLGACAGLLLIRSLPVALDRFFTGYAAPAWAWPALAGWLVFLWALASVLPMISIGRLRPVDAGTD